ncbi:MAG: 6-phosphofructokinase [Eubacteriaceae bacterium]|nr:6-phosphofructokinase [Eubacteriaceae bacterium]
MEKEKLAVLTSGGDSPGMNAAIRAVVRTSVAMGIDIYGIDHGYRGIYEGEIHWMDRYSVADIIQRGGTILYTDRCDRMMDEDGPAEAAEILNKNGITGLIIIGGDGTFKGGLALKKYGIRVAAVPGTIDNDIACTDRTIGFDTAVNTALDAISRIRDTSSSHNRVNLVQVMGRNCGNLALYAGLAGGAEAICVPEIPFDADEIAHRVIIGKNKGKLHCIIVFAEGAGDMDMLSFELQKKTGIEVRSTVLGYTQRGGSPTASDRILASYMGSMAVRLLAEGDSGKAVCLDGREYTAVPLEEATNMSRILASDYYELARTLSV